VKLVSERYGVSANPEGVELLYDFSLVLPDVTADT